MRKNQEPKRKQASSMNALRHGLTSRQLIVKDEDPAHLETLHARWREAYPTTNPHAADLVRRAANSEWLLLRAEHTFDHLNQTLFEIPATEWTKEQHAQYQLFSRYLTTNQRNLDRDRRTLLQYRREHPEDPDSTPQLPTYDPTALNSHAVEQSVMIREINGQTREFPSPPADVILLLAKRRFDSTLVTRRLHFPGRHVPSEYAWCAPQVALFQSDNQELPLYMTVKSLRIALQRETDGRVKFWPDLFAADYPILKPLLGDNLCPPKE